jgi:hypothetical protein
MTTPIKNHETSVKTDTIEQSDSTKCCNQTTGIHTPDKWSTKDEEQAQYYNMRIQQMTEIGHTSHCAQRIVLGDGKCECGLEQL